MYRGNDIKLKIEPAGISEFTSLSPDRLIQKVNIETD